MLRWAASLGTMFGLLLETVNVKVCDDSLAGPGLMPSRLTVCAAAFSGTVRSARAASVGGWVTERTGTGKVRGVVLKPALGVVPPWVTVAGSVGGPNTLGSGGKESVAVGL